MIRFGTVNSKRRRAVSYSDFRQIVRRFRPSDLLPRLGEIACSQGDPPYDLKKLRYLQPWAIATIARESILWGNEHRSGGLTDENLRILFNAHNNLAEGPKDPPENIHALLTRIAYEQLPYQESIFEELSRTHALLVDGVSHIDPEILSKGSWEDILGAPLEQVVGATFMLQTAASNNRGWFDPRHLENPSIADVLQLWPKEVILERAQQLSLDPANFKKKYSSVARPTAGSDRYSFNPLTSHPFIRWKDGRYLAPQPRLILPTVTPGNLYYAGVSALGSAFARDLGQLTENYVGRQLRTIAGADVHPEVVYGSPERKSIDWFLVLPAAVVLFEVKSTRFGLLERAGDLGFERRIRDTLGRAVGQIERTEQELRSGRTEFAHIPQDRPRIGVVVTAEPYYLANTPMARALLPATSSPFLTASLRDVERLVTLPASVLGERLSSIARDPERSTWNLSMALSELELGGRNPLLLQAWNSYSWPELDDGPSAASEIDDLAI